MLLWCASSRATVAGGRTVGVDAAALAFFLAQSLRLQEVEAEERMEEEERPAEGAGGRRKELVDRHAEQLALVRLDRLGSPAQTARLLVATQRRAVLTLSAKARRKKKKRRRRKRRRRPRSWCCLCVA